MRVFKLKVSVGGFFFSLFPPPNHTVSLCADSISNDRLVSEIFTLQSNPIWA